MKGLFVSYHAMLRINGLKWLLQTNQRFEVQHILSVIDPKNISVPTRIRLLLPLKNICEDLNFSMPQDLKVSEAFQILDTVVKKKDTGVKMGTKTGGN